MPAKIPSKLSAAINNRIQQKQKNEQTEKEPSLEKILNVKSSQKLMDAVNRKRQPKYPDGKVFHFDESRETYVFDLSKDTAYFNEDGDGNNGTNIMVPLGPCIYRMTDYTFSKREPIELRRCILKLGVLRCFQRECNNLNKLLLHRLTPSSDGKIGSLEEKELGKTRFMELLSNCGVYQKVYEMILQSACKISDSLSNQETEGNSEKRLFVIQVKVKGLDDFLRSIQENSPFLAKAKKEILETKSVSFYPGLGEHFLPGCKLVCHPDGLEGIPVGCSCVQSWYTEEMNRATNKVKRQFILVIEFLISVGDELVFVAASEVYPEFHDLNRNVPIKDFAHVKLCSHTESDNVLLQRLQERGQFYASVATKNHYLEYEPNSFYPIIGGGWRNNAVRPLSKGGRVMIDIRRGILENHIPIKGKIDGMSDTVKEAIKLFEQSKRTGVAVPFRTAILSSLDDVLEYAAQQDAKNSDFNLLWQAWPILTGFSFTARVWGKLLLTLPKTLETSDTQNRSALKRSPSSKRGIFIGGLGGAGKCGSCGYIQFQEKAFEQLVLAEDKKELIRAVARNAGSLHKGEDDDDDDDFTDLDVVANKGAASIFLLYGPPGCGKTLTAESIAELLKKPLYVVTAGDLGITASEVEKTLGSILELCQTWDALVLIDEADIFLEARNSTEIQRNALVCVMQRLLENYSGCLFMSSNRTAESIDPAVASRITVMLSYPPLDEDGRAKVWRNLIELIPVQPEGGKLYKYREDFSEEDYLTLAHGYLLNGQQIKNSIILARALVKERGDPLSMLLLRRAVTAVAGESSVQGVKIVKKENEEDMVDVEREVRDIKNSLMQIMKKVESQLKMMNMVKEIYKNVQDMQDMFAKLELKMQDKKKDSFDPSDKSDDSSDISSSHSLDQIKSDKEEVVKKNICFNGTKENRNKDTDDGSKLKHQKKMQVSFRDLDVVENEQNNTIDARRRALKSHHHLMRMRQASKRLFSSNFFERNKANAISAESPRKRSTLLINEMFESNALDDTIDARRRSLKSHHDLMRMRQAPKSLFRSKFFERNKANAISAEYPRKRSTLLINKMFESNELIDDKDSFNQFCVLSMQPKSIMQCEDFDAIGSNYLDSFVSKQIEIVDEYFTSDKRLSSEMFSSFCFPNGIKVRLIPFRALQGAKRLGWFDGSSDEYGVLSFTNEWGSSVHGVTITTKKVLHLPNQENLKRKREERRSARLISRAWHRYAKRNIAPKKWEPIRGMDRFITSIKKTYIDKEVLECSKEVKDYSSYAVSNYAKQQASLSYSTMVENDKFGEICVIEMCYILTDVKAKNFSLLFLALKQLIKLKIIRRQQVLEAMKTKLKFNRWQSNVKYPENDLDHINMHKPYFTAKFPPSLCFPRISIPLPLPQVREEWGLATLILRLGFHKLMKILMLLLLEKPLLVVGYEPLEVSVCTCTLLLLLSPFKWVSVFIPLLPDGILDFVESPVPFLAGVLADGEKEIEIILNDDSVQSALYNGLSVVDLFSGEVHFTKETESLDLLLKCDSILTMSKFEEMSNYEHRLQYLVTKEFSLLSFKTFFEYGASPSESVVLKKSLRAIKTFMKRLAGDMHSSPDAWKKFTLLCKDTDKIEMLPNLLLQPLKDEIIFLEMMVETQLFASYVEESMKINSSDVKAIEAAKMIISAWVRKYWKNRRTC